MKPPALASRPRFPVIDDLRGLAALAVAWYHFTDQAASPLVRASGSWGWLGVEVFFVISGFVIPYSMSTGGYSPACYPRFLLRRLARLEPPYLASIALVLVLNFLSARTPGFRGVDRPVSLAQLAWHLGYLIPLTPYGWLNVVYWSLAYEFAFYLLIGLAWEALAPRPLAVTFLAFAAVTAVTMRIAGPGSAILLLFFVGWAGMRLITGRDRWWECALLVALTEAAVWHFAGEGPALASAAALLLILGGRWPRLPALSYLGAVSYSLYLVHVPVGGRVVNLGRRFGHGAPYELALAAAALAVSLAAAALFSRWIEAPAHRLARRIHLRPRAAQVCEP